MRAVVYTLTLQEPLLATSLQGDPNSSVSLAYIPGSLVRGALIQHYIRTKNPQHFLKDENAQRLFIDGRTRYLHAYPLTERSRLRSLPTPRSLLRRKHDEWDENDPNSTIQLLDASHPECNAEVRNRFEQSDNLKPFGTPFCASPGEILYSYQPERRIAVHILRNPVKGRSLRNVPGRDSDQQALDGAVFRYDALAPTQQFQGAVLVDIDDDAVLIESALKELGTCWLGRSRSAQYGKTTISDVTIDNHWCECRKAGAEAPQLTAGDDNLHSITLVSDALLRTTQGVPVSILDNHTLAAYLGLNTGAVAIDDAHSFSTITEQSGFNRYWKLPLSQEYALAAGSVISFRLTQLLTAEQVTRLEQRGIGARRAEGFGRIAFNWHGELELAARKGSVAKDTPDSTSEMKTVHATALAKRMARQLHERSVEQSIVEFVQTMPVSNIPDNSQLGRLRLLVRQALPTNDIDYVRARFAEFKSISKHQFQRARLGNQPFDEWIEQLLTEPERVWTQFSNFQVQAIAGENAELNNRQVTLQLLAAVLAAATREERQETQR